MGKWATYQRRGSATVPPVDAPVLTVTGAGAVAWAWGGANPDEWILYQSPDNITFSAFNSYIGTERAADSLDGTSYYYVIRADALNVESPPPSNTVYLPV